MTALQEQVHERIFGADPYLTEDKFDIVTYDGNAVVVACPGSGKTRAVASRLAHRISNWTSTRTGIAALSFTNVAADEIRHYLRRDFDMELPDSSPHFIGTIDSFVYQHLSGPHASAYQSDLPARLEIILHRSHTEGFLGSLPRFKITFNKDTSGRMLPYPHDVPITNFHLKPDGKWTWKRRRNQEKLPEPDQKDIIEKKKALWRAKYMSHSDSMYIAYRILLKYPWLAKAIASRYPEIIVDECQDTSDVQHEIMNQLLKTALTEILMVGDPLQSIYEFNEAKPELMLSRIKVDNWHPVRLTGNHRSSTYICDAVSRFFAIENEMISMSKQAECRLPPILLRYPNKEIAKLPDAFEQIVASVEEQGLCICGNRRVVARWHRYVNALTGKKAENVAGLTHDVRRLVRSAVCRNDADYMAAYTAMEGVLCSRLFGCATIGLNREALDAFPHSYREWRNFVWRAVQVLPDLEQDLAEWITTTATALKTLLQEYSLDPVKNVGDVIRKPRGMPPVLAAAIADVPSAKQSTRCDTVHQVKGETLDAIMLVARDAGDVKTWLGGMADGVGTEEQRVAYVAMTRPRRLLVVALPDTACKKYADRFPGFQHTSLNKLDVLSGLCRGCTAKSLTIPG
ncbi:MAG: UvrD-helicase domain-containing protein [Armatimonadota bacterium]|nr:UvrD-helicase domain-containing protein [Armatimonadota bacterium]